MYNLTDTANRCIQVASQFAAHYTNEVGTEHILYSLCKVECKAKQLLEAYKVKNEFLANVSHELRTPLNAIIGFSEILSANLFGELNEKH